MSAKAAGGMDWPGLLRVGIGPARLGGLGLTPAEFWALTPAELALMLGIFADKFVLGVAAGVGSPVVHEAWFVAAASLSLGLFSGAFAARAAAVRRAVSAAAA